MINMQYVPKKKTFAMAQYYTDDATLSALISFNKQSSPQLTITFNGLTQGYVVPHAIKLQKIGSQYAETPSHTKMLSTSGKSHGSESGSLH